MNDDFDNAKDDKAMLAKLTGEDSEEWPEDYCARCGEPFTDGDADDDYCRVCRREIGR